MISVTVGCFNLSKQCRYCCISSGSSLFAKIPVLGVSSIQRVINNGALTLKASITIKSHSAFVIDLLNVLEASWSNSVYLDQTSPL